MAGIGLALRRAAGAVASVLAQRGASASPAGSMGAAVSVGVIIPVRNGAAHIREAVESALAQPDVRRVIVVDDGSTDASAAIVRAIPDPRLSLIAGGRLGVSAARNRGFAVLDSARADELKWVMFLDADDRLRPGAVAALLSHADDRCAAVYGDYERIDEAGRAIGRRRWLRARRKPSGDILQALAGGNFIVNGGVMLIRRPAFQAIGGFDETLRYCEDWHAFCRLAASGPIHFAPGVMALDYRVHAASAMMANPPSFALYRQALERVFSDPMILRALRPSERGVLKRRAEAHLRTYVVCQMLRARQFAGALPQSLEALRFQPTRAPRNALQMLGAMAGF